MNYINNNELYIISIKLIVFEFSIKSLYHFKNAYKFLHIDE